MEITYHVHAVVAGVTFTNLRITVGPRTTFADIPVLIARTFGRTVADEVTILAAMLVVGSV